MNIAFFLIPKSDVVYLPFHSTLRQALEKMEYHRYSAVPIIDEAGKYVGTITEGDLLWKIKNDSIFNMAETESIPLSEVPRRMVNHPVRIGSTMEELIPKAISQNFVPVVDDQGIFIGIIRRREIIEYCHELLVCTSNL
ncbi:MAG: CBS domain-containing protein [Bacillota bacterium]|nr:CBS domain-containing protein [Bacillota bacterium]